MKELQDQFSDLMDGLRCNLCNSEFKQKHSLLLHIGCKHGKVNNILKMKNFAPLPCPVFNATNSAMQKQLIQIKKESLDVSQSKPKYPTEDYDSESANDSILALRNVSQLLNDTHPAAPSAAAAIERGQKPDKLTSLD